jgi:hypothetical protein
MSTPIVWHESVERLLEELTDEAQVRARIHMKQYMSYRRRNQCYTLPVVILSVISGSGNFISESYTDLTKKYMIMGIGTLSIFVSIISAVSQYLKLAQTEEANRIASLQWGKFYSKIKFQLYLKRENREGCHDFLLSVFSEYDRLYEISPPLLSTFIKHIRRKLRNLDINQFKLPFYMNGVERVIKYVENLEESFVSNTVDDEKNTNI